MLRTHSGGGSRGGTPTPPRPISAGPVFRLLGAKGLGTSDYYKKEKMPSVSAGLLSGDLAWRQHDGGHTDGPNIEYFINWADKHFARKTPTQSDSPKPGEK